MDKSGLPKHVAIIMDGNGRWAKERNLARCQGHEQGLKTAREIASYLSRRGLSYLSYYVFSTENWKRSEEEVSFLFELLKKYLREELDFCLEHNIRVVHSGNLHSLPTEVQNEIAFICQRSSQNTGLVINLAINYGGQDEIIRAFHRYQNTKNQESLNCENLADYLDVPELPPVDLVIRTSGELRFSNFLIWQSAYAELFFCQKFWPDFDSSDLEQAFESFSCRNRRFGGCTS